MATMGQLAGKEKVLMGKPQAWQQQGMASLWTYPGGSRSFDGWHISADSDGCQSLLDLVAAMSSTSTPEYRTVALVAPSIRLLHSANRRSTPVRSMHKLKLEKSMESHDWNIAGQLDTATLRLGDRWHEALSSSIQAMAAGDGDFLIGPAIDGQKLWFWSWRLPA